jgi:tetratricopeptide (TPR) repeat protein
VSPSASKSKPKISGDRALVFAQAALKKRLVTREQAQECVKIARKLKKANKALPIETVFVRKGYLRQAEAAALVKRIRPKGSQPALALVPEKPRGRARCGSCDRDPGDEDDCYHCGADVATGGPGPRATVCESCSGVVLRGSAICFHCGQTMRSRGRRRASGRGGGVLDRLIVLATILGVGYFLVYRNLVAPAPPPTAEALPTAPSQDPAVESALKKAAGLASKGDRPEAAEVLQEALAKAAPGDQPRIQRALALVADGDVASKAARAALGAGEDPLLRRRLAKLAWDRGEAKVAKSQLGKISEEQRLDADWRLLAAVEHKLEGDWSAPLLRIKKPLANEKAPLAAALWQRGLEHLGVKRVEQALVDLERAVELDPKRSTLHASLGAAYLEAGKPAEAKTAYQAAIRTKPRPTHYLGLALAQEGLNERAAAIRSYESFLQITKGEAEHAAQQKKVRARLDRLRAPAATPTPN